MKRHLQMAQSGIPSAVNSRRIVKSDFSIDRPKDYVIRQFGIFKRLLVRLRGLFARAV